MNTSIRSVIIGAIIGAVVTLVIANLGDNRVHAQQAAAEEYKCFPLPNEFRAGDMQPKLNELGKQGWVLRCSAGATLFFARPAQ